MKARYFNISQMTEVDEPIETTQPVLDTEEDEEHGSLLGQGTGNKQKKNGK